MAEQRAYWKRSFDNSAIEYGEDYKIAQWSKHGLERRLSVFKDVFQRIYLDKAQAVLLDAGCGPGTYSRVLLGDGYNVIALDYSENMILRARRKLTETSSDGRGGSVMFAVSGVEQLPIRANALDLVLCLGVFQHIVDPYPTLREFHRVLKPGSFCIVNTLNKRFILKRNVERLQYHDPFEIVNLSEIVGFKCDLLRPLVLLPIALQFLEKADEAKFLWRHLWGLAHDFMILLHKIG
jgi:ubiquinone/menaquinone biosynthesis C-methylase UbiE